VSLNALSGMMHCTGKSACLNRPDLATTIPTAMDGCRDSFPDEQPWKSPGRHCGGKLDLPPVKFSLGASHKCAGLPEKGSNWVAHYNRGRPHTSLGPGIPDPPVDLPFTPHIHRRRIPSHCKVVARPILAGLHHEYSLAAKAP